MKVYIVFKTVLAWHNDLVVDSVWRSMPQAYDRLVEIKGGGRIEVHDLDKIKDGGEDTCKHCRCYDKLQRKIQKMIYAINNHAGNCIDKDWLLHELKELKKHE